MTPPTVPIPGLVDLPPGPGLDAALSNDELIGELRAWSRLHAQVHARKLRAIAAVATRSRKVRDPIGLGWAAAEIAAALVWTDGKAARELEFADTLLDRLPLVFAAFEVGDIDHGKAWTFADVLGAAEITDAQITAICAALLPVAPGLTTGQLRVRLMRAILQIDPDYAGRCYWRAVRERKVCGYLAADGTGVITGSGLPAEEAAAACDRVDQLVAAVKRAGHPAAKQQLAADVFVRLLDGRLHGMTRDEITHTLLTDPTTYPHPEPDPEPEGGGGRTVRVDPWNQPPPPEPDPLLEQPEWVSRRTDPVNAVPGLPGSGGSPVGGWAGVDASGFGDGSGSGADSPACGSSLAEPIPVRPLSGEPATGEPATGGPATGGPATNAAALAGSVPAAGSGVDSASPDRSATGGATPPGSAVLGGPNPPESSPGGAAIDGTAPALDHPAPAETPPPGSPPAHPTKGPPRRIDPSKPVQGLPPGIEIRVGLATLMGLDERPGEIPGWGPVLPDTARAAVTKQRSAEWRFAILDPGGHLELAGITRHRPATTMRQTRGGIVELHITATQLAELAANPERCGEWAGVIADLARQHTQRDQLRQQLDAHPGRRFVRAALRRHIQVRDRTCVAPGCRRPAARCEADHTHAYARGGTTTSDNAGPGCLKHHLMKETSWTLEQPEPGRFRWTSPLGQVYETRGEPISPPLPEPVERGPDDTPPEPGFGPVHDGPTFYRAPSGRSTPSTRPPPPQGDPDDQAAS